MIQNWEDWLMDQISVLTFSTLEKCANRNLMKFKKQKSQVPQLRGNNPRHQDRLEVNQMERSFALGGLERQQAEHGVPSTGCCPS